MRYWPGLAFAFALLLLASGLDAAAGTPSRRVPVQTFQQGGVGCYWYRGREFCSRYCYLEINNKRYCVERERNAVSQAPIDRFLGPAPGVHYRGVK